jgi:hypothetical protein
MTSGHIYCKIILYDCFADRISVILIIFILIKPEACMVGIKKAGYCLVVAAFAVLQTIPVETRAAALPVYPQPVLTPGTPTQNDSAALWLVLGQNGNSCVPTYAASFRITQVSNNVCVRAPCPQDFVISLSYSANPLPLNMVCAMVVTSYGPRFQFGKLLWAPIRSWTARIKSTRS